MEMFELAAELKWCRERIASLEAERDQLLATPADKREDLRCVIADISAQCAALWAERDQLRAKNAQLITTLKLIADHYDASDRQIALVEAALAADDALREGGE